MKSKLLLLKPSPLTPKLITSTARKRRMVSQQTIDTNVTETEENPDKTKIKEEHIINEIRTTLQMIEGYQSQIMRKKGENSVKEEMEFKNKKIQNYEKEIRMIEEEIGRLKEVYNRPKVSSQTRKYTQLHLKSFTLADEIVKQREHLKLHITHHRDLKAKAKELHHKLKEMLPTYLAHEKARGFKPISYGQFRKKAVAQKKQNLIKSKIRTISEQSLSRRSSRSVRSIIQREASLQVVEEKRNLWYMQKRKRVASKAYNVSKKKHCKEVQSLQDQLRFLREQDGALEVKIEQLNKQIASFGELMSVNSTNMLMSRRLSKLG